MEPTIHDLIAEFTASGEYTQTAFCEEKGVSFHKFNYHWRRQQKQQQNACRSGFASLKVRADKTSGEPAKSAVTARLYCGNQVRLKIQGEFSARFLRELAGC